MVVPWSGAKCYARAGVFKRELDPPQMPPRNGAQPLGLSLEFEARFAAGAAIRIDQRRSQSFGHGVDDSATDAGAFRRTIADPTDAVVRDAQPDLVGLKLAERDADFTALLARIGIFESVGDEFGHHHADRYRFVGRHFD